MNNNLFRAKSIETGEWIYGFYGIRHELAVYEEKEGKRIIVPFREHHYISVEMCAENEDMSRLIHMEINPKTLCRYTGKLDMFNKAIFENDIVETKYGRRCEVIYKSTRAYNGFDFEPLEAAHRVPDESDLWEKKNLKVIGNIFDNQEWRKI